MATKSFSTIPAIVTLTNNGTEDVGFRYFKVNFIEVIKAGDSVVLKTTTSEETAYYAALADTKVGLAVAITAPVAE